MHYLLPTIKKGKHLNLSDPYSNFYIYYLRIYTINLKFSFINFYKVIVKYRAIIFLGTQERGVQRKPKKLFKNGPPTTSLPINSTRQGRRLSPCRVNLRGGTYEQVHAEQLHEVERTTKSLPSNIARQSGRPSPVSIKLV